MKKIFYLIAILIFSLLSCEKERNVEPLQGVFFKEILPTFALQQVKDLTANSAVALTTITNTGSSTKFRRGVCYSENANVSIKDIKIEFAYDNSPNKLFEIKNLKPNTTYYIKFYIITTNNQVLYTNGTSFITLVPFNVKTFDLKVSSPKLATVSGSIENMTIGSRIVTYGVVLSNSLLEPTITNNIFIAQLTGQNITQNGSFTSTFQALEPNTMYFARAFAIDFSGYIAYGEKLSFQTPAESKIIQLSGDFNFGNVIVGQTSPAKILTIRNTGNTDLIISSLTLPAGFVSNFTNQITIPANGVQNINITFSPTQAINYSGIITVNGNQTSGINTVNVSGTGLIPITVPVVQTINFTNITKNSVTFNGALQNLGNATTCRVGFVYSASSQVPTLSNVEVGGQNLSAANNFSADVSNLSGNTTYYFRAYATNSAGTVYGAVQSFKTESNVIQPTIQTVSVTNITQNSATITGRLTNLGTFSSVVVSFFVSTSPEPTVTNSIGVQGLNLSILGNFSLPINSNINPNTTYYFRAFAATQTATILGNVLSFTTPAPAIIPPQVKTISAVVSANNSSLYTLTGEVISMGSASSVEVGFEFSIDGGQTFLPPSTSLSTRTSTGTYTSLANDFQIVQNYHYRAYAKTSAGTKVYGEIKTIDNIKRSLVLYLPFSGNANDISGNNNNGTINGATLTIDRNGNSNNAYAFGVNKNIKVNKSSSLSFNQNFSYSAWIRLNSNNVNSSIIYDRGCSASGGAIFYQSQGFYFSSRTSSNMNSFGGAWSIDYNLGKWTLLTTTYSNGVMKWYQDGQIVGYQTMPQGASFIDSSQFDLFIGNTGCTNMQDFAFNGSIDEFRMYNRALTDAEVQLLYQQ